MCIKTSKITILWGYCIPHTSHLHAHIHTQEHRRNVTRSEGGGGGGGGASKKTCCGIICIGKFLMLFWWHGRTECDSQKEANYSALEHSRRNSTSQRFLFQRWHRGCKVPVSLQKNEAAWKGCKQWEGQRNMQEMSQRSGCDRFLRITVITLCSQPGIGKEALLQDIT